MIEAMSDLGAGIIGTTAGGMLSFVRVWMNQRHERQMQKDKLDNSRLMKSDEHYSDVYTQQSKSKYFKFTRRIIAIIFVFSMLSAAILLPMLGTPVTIGYQETNGTIASLFYANNDIKWMTFNTAVIPPSYVYYLGLIITSYFFGRMRG